MRIRRAVIFGTLALLGIAVALGIGLAANAISGDSIGLSAQPLRAGERLAPPDRRGRSGAEDGRRPARTSTTTTITDDTAAPVREPGDDHGGRRSGRSRGGSGSSGGSASSGDSGSSGGGGSTDDHGGGFDDGGHGRGRDHPEDD